MRKPKGDRIIKDAKSIEARLAAGERVGPIAKEYGVSHTCLKMNLESIIGQDRWRQIVRQGCFRSVKPLTNNSPSASDAEAQRQLESNKGAMFEDYYGCAHCGSESNREHPCPKCLTGYVRLLKRLKV